MKQFGFSLLIEENSNVAYSHSECNWSSIRDGDLLKISNLPTIHTIQRKEKSFFSKKFNVVSNNTIAIDGDYSSILFESDLINLICNEYEILNIKEIKNGGNGYNVGDIIAPQDGVASINLFDNSKQEIKLKVESIGENGSITSVKVLNGGIYSIVPSGVFTGGAILDINYRILDKKNILERNITSLSYTNEQTIIVLDINLPDFVKNGDVTFNKWKLFLSEKYNGKTLINVNYEIIRDYTPNIKLPLVLKNSLSFEEIYNESMKKIDYELQKIKDKLASIS